MAARDSLEAMEEQELATFARKIATWGETLTPAEQLFLDAILIHAAAATAGDVQGFMARLPDEFPEARDAVHGRILCLLQSIYPAYRITEEGKE